MMKCGMECEIIKYRDYHDIDVEFTDKTILQHRSCNQFNQRSIKNPNIKPKHLGETKTMNCGMKATVIDYITDDNITIQFEDGIIVKNRSYGNFKKGSIGHPNKRTGVSINELVCLYYFQ